MDERSTEDLLRFAQQYANMLRYFGGAIPTTQLSIEWVV